MELMNTTKNIYSWLTKTNQHNSIKSLSDNAILNIANDVNSIFADTNLIENKPELTLPRLAVVGTQSSGKSSVLNSIITMDFLPTGEEMVTRNPLEIRLHKLSTGSSGWAEFSHHNFNSDTSRIIDLKVDITTPTPTPEEVNKIRSYIAHRTIELSGPGMNISDKPIILDIYSSYVPNLSLVDLPGLTEIACTDKGQPEDIMEKIENLSIKYIKQERTIILAIMEAKKDLQRDRGLALIKKYDKDSRRTIGVLTKPDLMNTGNHVGDYLISSSNVSNNLKLNYGYFVVKNRSNKEADKYNILEGFDLERQYFSNHTEYRKSLYEDKIGMLNLTESLNKILVSSINELIPSVLGEIGILEEKIRKKLDDLGDALPDTKDGKIAVLNRYASSFNSKFLDSIESRGAVLNTGKKIKDIFNDYKVDLLQVKPFSTNNAYDKSYFSEILSSFEGNHMSFHIPPVQIIESCMADQKLRPIFEMSEPTLLCIDRICTALVDLVRDVLVTDEFSKYPELVSFITSTVVENLITNVKIETKKKVLELLEEEENYIWTDNPKFLDTLTNMTKTKFDINTTKIILDSYYSSIKEVISHSVPKIIMTHMVRFIERHLLVHLMHTVVNEDKIELLKEDSDVEKQRIYYSDIKNRIDTVKKTFRKSI